MKRMLSPKELATAIGVSESSLKRWTDEGLVRATRTAGGHRKIPLAEAIRFIRESRSQLVHPEVLGLADLETVSGDLPSPGHETDRLTDLLSRGESAAARGLVLWLFMNGNDVASICDGPLREAMAEIGKLWRDDEYGVFIEHRATDICIQALDQLRIAGADRAHAPVAVGGAPTGDPYFVPSLMAAASLHAEGFQAVNLGPDTPRTAMAQAALRQGARIVWLSVTADVAIDRLHPYVEGLLQDLEPAGINLVVGGRAQGRLRRIKADNLHVGSSMAELVAFAKGVVLARGGRDA